MSAVPVEEAVVKQWLDSWKQPLLLSVSHMFECCFPLLCKSGVHGSDQNVAFEVFLRSTYLMQIEKCIDIQSLSNFLFLNPLSSLPPYFSYSLSLLLLSLLDETVFYVTKFICGVESASSPSSSKHHICQHMHLFFISVILSSFTPPSFCTAHFIPASHP